jgi:tetratricopeptide (TPR) repeat protein
MMNYLARTAALALLLTAGRLPAQQPSSPQAAKDSPFEAGNRAFERHDYREAVRLLEQALAPRPDPDVARARLQLARAYHQLAVEAKRDELLGASIDQEYVRRLRQNYQQFMRKAAGEYQQLVALLEKPESADLLSEAERLVVPFAAGDCLYNLGQYEEALALYERQIKAKGAGSRVVLTALGYAARCHAALGQTEKFRQRLCDIKKALEELDEATRREWDSWLEVVTVSPR